MKKIDKLIISSFIPPFVVTFMIAMFVLLMQILWLYIDDIAGKGLGLFILVELLAYKCVSLIPMALPLAMLISSVMVLGNMAEHYELSSFKSAGVPLWRVMLPLMFIGLLTSGFSYFCSNNLIPVANLQFGSRMYDIQQQKPALRLDTGVFNDDFDGYAIHIGNKEGDRGIEDILIYDHQDANRGRLGQIVAKEGEMYSTEDGSYFVMNLQNGHQYMETKPSGYGKSQNYPFVRTNFDSWNKVFDLSEFQLNRTNKDLFSQNRSMLSTAQLAEAVDSLDYKIEKRVQTMANTVSGYFYNIDTDTTDLEPTAAEIAAKEYRKKESDKMRALADSSKRLQQIEAAKRTNVKPKPKLLNQTKKKTDSLATVRRIKGTKPLVTKKINQDTSKKGTKSRNARLKVDGQPILQDSIEHIAAISSIVSTFPSYERVQMYSKAKTFARSIHSQAESATRSLDRLRESKVKHIYDLHMKYSMAAVCFIFLFIGAPMGAIIRKGGFGYPILVAIIFFVTFIVLTIFYKKVAETFAMPAVQAAWMPCIILFPIGIFLTYRAMNDSKILGDKAVGVWMDIVSFFGRLLRFLPI